MPSLLLLLTLGASMWLDVPFVKQQKDGCGSASVWMILQYWKTPATPDVAEIHQALYSIEGEGVYARDMEAYFEKRRFNVVAFTGNWDDLEQHLSQGRPLVVCLELSAHGVPLHYVVVAGLDNDSGVVFVNDPAQRKLLAMERAPFEAAWQRAGNWTLLAVPAADTKPEEVTRPAPAIVDTPIMRLASTAFREHRLHDAEGFLISHLQQDHKDSYASDFLATTFFMEGNNEAALKYWNRQGKPVLRNVHMDPPLHTNLVLLDSAMTFRRGEVISLEDYRTSRRRLTESGVFPVVDFELSPTEADDFNVTLHATEHHGPEFVSWFTELPVRTVTPGWNNLWGRTTNIQSLFRWDKNKRREQLALSGPIGDRIGLRYQMSLDRRDERWLHDGDAFTLDKSEFTAQIRSIVSDRWGWKTGLSLSRRNFSNALSDGTALRYDGGLDYRVLDIPEQRLRIDSSWSVKVGKTFATTEQRFTKAEGALSMRWLPRSSGDDYETKVSIRSGAIFGTAPFDEQYALGFDRDADLWLYAHPAFAGGKKGAALIGKNYVLATAGLEKLLGQTAFLRFHVGPLLDIAHVSSIRPWAFDGAMQLRIEVMRSLSIGLSVGRDFKSGHHQFNAAALPL